MEIDNTLASPFHDGEQAMQTRAGKRERMEAFGKRVIRNFMPDEHRDFYTRLPFVVVGAVDANGDPWATLLSGKPGFIDAPDERTLRIKAAAHATDPTAEGLAVDHPVGLLGIELPTRRRNRMNGRICDRDASALTVRVDQAFGNCPQYIHARAETLSTDTPSAPTAERFTGLTGDAAAFIVEADTFFVSSYVPQGVRPDVEGADVSHRGGLPGFVRVDENTLTIPDFRGNNHFNTLGNFLLNPKAGLVFPDFASGDLLQLTGAVELLDAAHPEVQAFRGAQRGWRVRVERGNWLRRALPWRFADGEASPRNAGTDTWANALARTEAAARHIV